MVKYEVMINNKLFSAAVKKYTPNEAELEINGITYQVKLDQPITMQGAMASPPIPVSHQPNRVNQAVQAVSPAIQVSNAGQNVASAPSPTGSTTGTDSYVVSAPIPGSVLDIKVKPGDTVEAGQVLCKMEAMKMENDINAGRGGIVQSISVSVGDAVNQGSELMVIG